LTTAMGHCESRATPPSRSVTYFPSSVQSSGQEREIAETRYMIMCMYISNHVPPLAREIQTKQVLWSSGQLGEVVLTMRTTNDRGRFPYVVLNPVVLNPFDVPR